MERKHRNPIENTLIIAATKLTRDTLIQLDREAARQERTRSDLMRILLKRALANATVTA